MMSFSVFDVYPFFLAFSIGLAIGIERERSRPRGKPSIGVRSITLIGLLGSIVGRLNDVWVTAVASSFVAALILLAYWRSTRQAGPKDLGITTELSAALVYALGLMVFKEPFLSAMMGVLLLATLLVRKRLHFFSRHWLRPEEIEACTLILFFAIAVLPFFPNVPIDPWSLFVPRNFGILIVLLASIQFGGYLAIRIFGERVGLAMTGFFGGLISSTAVFLHLPRLLKSGLKSESAIIAMALFATAAKLIELGIVLLAASTPLFEACLPSLALMIALSLAVATLLSRKKVQSADKTEHPHPLDIRSVLKLATFIVSMIFVIGLARQQLGSQAAHLISYLGGLFELHSVSMATASFTHQGIMPPQEAYLNIALALAGSFTSKIVILFTVARGRFAWKLAALLVGILSAGFCLGAFFTP